MAAMTMRKTNNDREIKKNQQAFIRDDIIMQIFTAVQPYDLIQIFSGGETRYFLISGGETRYFVISYGSDPFY